MQSFFIGEVYWQNCFRWLQVSGSVWMDVECIIGQISFPKVSAPRRISWLIFRVIWNTNEWNRYNMCAIVMSSGGSWSIGGNIGSKKKCYWTNGGILNKVCKLSGFVWICVWRIVGVIWDPLDLHKYELFGLTYRENWLIESMCNTTHSIPSVVTYPWCWISLFT
jgi:hypothetical protein